MKKLFLVLVLLVSTFIAGCGGADSVSKSEGGGKNGKDTLVIVDWGGAITDAHKKTIFEPFEKKHGVKIVVNTPTDYGKFKAMVESGNVEWDVVNVDSDFVLRGANDGLLEKLDYSVINKEGVIPELVHDYGIGAELFSVAISYNTDAFPTGKHPKNWEEFWDTKEFPGARSLWKYPTGTFEAALLADGVRPEDMYPLDVERALKSLDKIKDDVSVWWTTGAQPPQLLASGEVKLAAAWNGRVMSAKAEGAPENVEYNNAVLMSDSWVVPKGTKKKDLAMEFINFAIAKEQQAAFSSEIPYSPINEKALDLLDAETIKQLGQTGENRESQLIVDLNWWDENFDAVNERFQEWLLE
ncbi:MAG TPA: ABC transporter substrate-binding protein [Bacillus sp. (in: firmicutes)]|nr:ABC transporter substrate-binding protein [Bacillus sp. (in: firmicutes)]